LEMLLKPKWGRFAMTLLLIFSILYNPDIIAVSCLAVYYAFNAISSLSLKFTLFQSCINNAPICS
jgi:hypothetical protein